MDSKPVFCLPRGSIVTALKSTVSDDYDILSRRILVKHLSEETGVVTEGWASVQSSQGYIILSPLVSLCYENTRWGNTRPIIRQCGHAAHLRCVETHTLSLHSRAQGEQPYDGRFAANIDDGEFLCPLCKQLSNILIPRDGCARNRCALDKSGEMQNAQTQSPEDTEQSLRNLLTKGTTLSKADLDAVSDIGKKALMDFGAHLLQAMDVPWERTTGARKRKHRRWHPAIQRWDYEEEDDDITPQNTSSSVKSVLRLLRQQHIAWSAIGHSAAAAEASVRGIEEVLPFGSFSKTDEPWSGYSDAKDSDPMLLELTRTMTGAAGLLEVLIVEMAKQLNGNDIGLKDTEVSIVGRALADILGGRSWALDIKQAQNGEIEKEKLDGLILWSHLTALMASTPCHVARDGMISQRHEARAAAAAMWTVRGSGTQSKASGEPPVPLAIDKIFGATATRPPEIKLGWGTMSPTVPDDSVSSLNCTAFRPSVASAFLHAPLLAWDLNTLAGALFSSVLLNKTADLPDSEDLLNLARLLIAGRMVQALVTPHGFDSLDNMEIDEEDEEGRWNPGEIEKEGEALAKLLSHCRARIDSKSLDTDTALASGNHTSSTTLLFGNVGRAILPFARSVILMSRACLCAIKTRQRKDVATSENSSDKILESVLDGSETLTTNDGFFILKEMKGPLPSLLIEESGSWFPLINRWLTAVIGLEKHHGSRGQSVIPELTRTTANQASKDDDKMTPVEADAAQAAAGEPSHGSSVEQKDQPQHAETPHRPMVAQQLMSSDTDSNDENQMDHDSPAGNAGVIRFFGDSHAVDEHLDSDEDLIEEMEMDEAEEMVGFADQVPGNAAFAGGAHGAGGNEADDSADEPSSSGSDEGDGDDSSYVFAGVSQSPIVSYQPSLLATQSIGPGRQGSMFESTAASAVMADLSHLGLTHRKGKSRPKMDYPDQVRIFARTNYETNLAFFRHADIQFNSSSKVFCRVIRNCKQSKGAR
jgi:hypothetical protein